MILIEPNKPGRLWLIAMFKYYCRRYDCTFIAYPGGKYEAVGKRAAAAQYAYEIAHGRLMIKTINAIATQEGNRTTITTNVVKDFVKDLYRRKRV